MGHVYKYLHMHMVVHSLTKAVQGLHICVPALDQVSAQAHLPLLRSHVQQSLLVIQSVVTILRIDRRIKIIE